MLINDNGVIRCFPNICTHRGHTIVSEPGCAEILQCRYHGRRFGLDGRIRHMPEFKQVEGFPAPTDDLLQMPLETWGPLVFTGLDPRYPFAKWVAPLARHVGFLPLDAFRLDAKTLRTYEFDSNWALYVENYLEGFHIPFIHQKLTATIDFEKYATECYEYSTLQTAPAAAGEPAFELPAGHPDSGRRIAAYYYWLFPNVMLNFYPWGLSVNIVEPLSPARTRVRFAGFVWKPEFFGKGAGGDLHTIEMEDEAAVVCVSRNMKSRFAPRMRYSPTQETGVHHFHRMLVKHCTTV